MDKSITIYEVRYFNIYTDTSYVATSKSVVIFKQFLSQMHSQSCILTLAGDTCTIREYSILANEYYPDETTIQMYESEVDDTVIYLTDFMMEQAREIIHGDIAYFASSLPDMLNKRIMPFCRGAFKDKLMSLICIMAQRVIVDSKDSCIDIIKGICSLDLFFSHINRLSSEYMFDNEEV